MLEHNSWDHIQTHLWNLMISSTATSGVRKHCTCTDILSLNIELIRVVAQEKFILLNCLCSVTNTRVIAARPGASGDPSKSSNEAILPNHTYLHAPLPQWVYLLATMANFRNGRRQEAYLSSHKELALMVVLSQAWGPALARKYRRKGCSLSIWKQQAALCLCAYKK